MKKAEKILICLFIVFGILRNMNIVGFGFFYTITGLILLAFYFLGGFILFNDIRLKEVFKRSSYVGIGLKEIILSVLAGQCMGCVIISFLFIVNRWPATAGKWVSYSALISSLPIIVICAILAISNLNLTSQRILWRLAPATLVCFILFITA